MESEDYKSELRDLYEQYGVKVGEQNYEQGLNTYQYLVWSIKDSYNLITNNKRIRRYNC